MGKTAVVEGLAQLVADEQVPDILIGKKIYMLDISALVAGFFGVPGVIFLLIYQLMGLGSSGSVL